MNGSQDLTFQESPTFHLGTNTFEGVPVVLQYGNEPLIEVSRWEDASYGAQFRIFNQDGVYLAKVRNNQIYRSPDGEKSNLFLRHFGPIGSGQRGAKRDAGPSTVCELDGRTLFELKREGAASLRGLAELFTPDGTFIKFSEKYAVANPLKIAPNLGFPVGHALFRLHHLTITGGLIGIHYLPPDCLIVGVGGNVSQDLTAEVEPLPLRPGMPWVDMNIKPPTDGRAPSCSNIRITYGLVDNSANLPG